MRGDRFRSLPPVNFNLKKTVTQELVGEEGNFELKKGNSEEPGGRGEGRKGGGEDRRER